MSSAEPGPPNDPVKEYKEKLRDRVDELNMQTCEYPKISIENDVDMDPFPTNFEFIISNHAVASIPEVSEKYCGCKIDCMKNVSKKKGESKKTCFKRHGFERHEFPYKNNKESFGGNGKKHSILKDYLIKSNCKFIRECNKICECLPTCGNRVVQNGSSLELCIYKTENMGWGVKTLEGIPKGAFVIEYVGEVCSHKEIKRRSDKYGSDDTYLYNINGGNLENPNVIDATYYGNVSRFINHSCKPNLQMQNVLINSSESTHRIAFFATKNIKQNEILTVDYALELSGDADDEPLSKDKFKCLCGKSCRGYMLQKKYINL